MFENLTDLREVGQLFFFVTSVMDQICLHWKLANVLMPQKSCANAKKTLNLSKCMSHLPTPQSSPPPKPDPSEAETCGTRSQESVSISPYIATYHSRPFILSKLFSQVDKHEKNMTYPGLFKRDFLLNMIHCALISFSFIKCSMPALKRTLSTPLSGCFLFDSIVR